MRVTCFATTWDAVQIMETFQSGWYDFDCRTSFDPLEMLMFVTMIVSMTLHPSLD